MTFDAHVPFPAEAIGECRYCGSKIGWVTREGTHGVHRFPVETKGFYGVPVSGLQAGVRGIQVQGTRALSERRVREPRPGEPPITFITVFPEHNCPRRKGVIG